MTLHAVEQVALDETVIEDADLEATLEARESAKEKAGFARKAYREADEQAKGEIEKLGFEEGVAVRVGRFRVEKVAVAAKSVSFETGPTSRLKITAPDDA